MNDDIARLIRNIQAAAQPVKTVRVATITNVEKNDQGLAISAIANVGDEPNVRVRLAQGIGTVTHVGETWLAELEGGATGTWKLTECVDSRFQRIADQTDYTLPTPQVPTVALGGIYTESAQAGVGTPNANPDPQTANADAYIYYQSIVPGSYSVFDQPIKQVVYQVREESFEEWGRTQVADLYPNRKVELTLSGSVTSSGTALPVSGASSYAGYLFDEQPALWRVESEVILGIYAAGTIRVVEHNGAGSAVRGQGFVTSTGGRGLAQGGSASAHDTGAVVELLSGQITLPGLRPGSNYEVHLAFANQANRPGPWSAVQSFTAWQQEIKPSAPGTVTVEHLSGVLNASWTRVITDVEGNVRADIRRYAIARHTAALAATATLAAVTAVATVIAGTSTPLSVSAYPVPATQGYGNYIGVAAVSDSGLLGEWKWGSDTLAPPYPDPSAVVMYEVEEGIAFNVPDSSNSFNAQTGGTVALAAHRDPGFYEYLLLQSGSNNGTAAVIAGRNSGSSGVFPINGGVTGWYKLVAADRSGNYSNSAAPNNSGYATGWKFIFSRYAEIGLPPNGNFQIPNETDTDAKGWSPKPSIFVSAVYQNTGGKEGNRVYKYSVPSGGHGGGVVVLEGSISRIIPAGVSGTGEVWLYQDSGITKDYLVFMYFLGYASDDGSGPLSGGQYTVFNSVAVSVPSGTWTRISLGTVTDLRNAADRSGRYFIDVRTSTAGGSNPHNLYIDAAKFRLQ